MDSLLGKIKRFVSHFAVVISDMLDTDVIIVDSNMEIVGSKLLHSALYNDIKIGTLIADVIINNTNIIIEDKKGVEGCKACNEFDICKIKGFVGVPILYKEQVIGAIALILTRTKVKPIFEKLDSAVIFMENMSDIIGMRMTNYIEKDGLKQKLYQIESILDMMEDAVLYTDIYGNIIYMNQQFKNQFYIEDKLIGKNIIKLYPEFELYYNRDEKIENVKVSLDYHKGYFYGIMNRKIIYISESQYGFIFCLKLFKNITQNSTFFNDGTTVTLPWLERNFDYEGIEIGRRYLESEENLLIYSEENSLNELLAKAIINQSRRRLNTTKTIYIKNIYRDLLDDFLMGEYGILRSVDGGTLIISQPEQMSLHIQEKLLQFIMTSKLKLDSGKFIHLDVRVIFCTNTDLKEMVKKGYFSETLYHYMSSRIISYNGNIYRDYNHFSKYCMAGLRYYCKLYKKNRDISQQLIYSLWKEYRYVPLSELEKILEITIKDNVYNNIEIDGEEFKSNMISIKEMEEEQLKILVQMGYSRKEIGEVLKMSRTTLYRKLKEYGLQVKRSKRTVRKNQE